MFTALEGLVGTGTSSSLSQTLLVASILNVSSLNAPTWTVFHPGVPLVSWRAPWARSARCSGQRPCSPGCWDGHSVLCPSSL